METYAWMLFFYITRGENTISEYVVYPNYQLIILEVKMHYIITYTYEPNSKL